MNRVKIRENSEINLNKEVMKLSVIVPAYNEENRIAVTLEHINSYLVKQAYDYEIIIVVNGSTDRTYEVAKKIADEELQKAVIVEIKEPGKGNAVKRAILDNASGDIILFMDADEATPLSEVDKFFPYFEQGYDIVIGSRYLNPSTVTVKQPFYRVFLSRGSNMLIQWLAVPGIKDTQLGFKAFKHNCAKDIFRYITVKGWGFDFELLTIAMRRGCKIKEVPVAWAEPGHSHLPLSAYINSLFDLFKIKVKAIRGDYNKNI
jgi:dolichyl-phosphate beta-glucosyltransferase